MVEEGIKVRYVGDATDLEDASKRAVLSTQNFAKAHEKMGMAAYQARYAVIDLSHTIRDIPYALNNPAILAGPFDRMFQAIVAVKQETGSFKGVLSTLGAQLTGGAGIMIGFNLVTTAVSLFAQKMASSGDAVKSQADKIQAAKKELQDYVTTLSGIARVNVLGGQNSAEEITNLRTLYEATQNHNIALSERKKLVDQLQSLYPQYFKNISDETILAGGAKTAYDNLTRAIINYAKAQAYAQEITEIQKQIIAKDSQQATAFDEAVKAKLKLDAEKSKGYNRDRSEIQNAQAAQYGVLQSAQSINSAQDEYNKGLKKTTDIQKERNSLEKQMNTLENSLGAFITQNPDALIKPGGNLKGAATTKEKSEFPFFDNILGFNPEKEGLKPSEKAAILSAVRNYYNTVGGSITALKDILSEKNQDVAVENAQAYWKAYQKGFVEKSFIFDSDKAGLQIVHDPSEQLDPIQKELEDKLRRKPILIPFEIQSKINAAKELETTINEFGAIGKQLGNKAGDGFGDIFEKVFKERLAKAIASGKTGEELQKFEDSLTLNAKIEAVGIKGVNDSVDSLFQSIADGGKNFENIGQTMINIFKQMGVEIAATLVKAELLKALKISGILGGGDSGQGAGIGGIFSTILGLLAGGVNVSSGYLPGSFAGGAPAGVASSQLVATVRGNDLQIMLNRNAAQQGRVG